MDAWQIYSAAKRHKYLIALSMIVATTAGAMVTLFLPTYYTAATMLMPSERAIRSGSQNPTDQPANPAEIAPRDTRITDLVMLAKSRSVAERVAVRTGLRPAVLMDRVNVDRVFKDGGGTTDLIAVVAKTKDPRSAVKIANVWSEEFANYYEEVAHQEAVQSREFLEDMLRKTKAQLDVAQQDLANFYKQRGITSLPAEVDAALAELTPLRSERDSLQARLAEINAKILIRRQQLGTIRPVRRFNAQETPTAAIEALRKSIADSKAELIKLSQTYTNDYFRIRELRQEIAATESELRKQLKRTETVVKVEPDLSYSAIQGEIKDLEADRSAGQARLVRLTSLIKEDEAKVSSYSGLDLKMDSLKRIHDDAKERYSAVAAQLQTARINERISIWTGAIKLVDRARSAAGPMHSGPAGWQIIVSAMILGLLLGSGGVLAVEALDTRVRTADDASDLLQLPVTGVIPSLPGASARSSATLVTQSSPMSPFAESYRFLATEVLLDAAPKGVHSIMVATAKPGQGGSSTLCNLAITLAQASRRVVLVDADFRRPSIHLQFSVENDIGLADLLRGTTAAVEALKPTFVTNLEVLTAGTDIDNPWALLRSARMPEVLEELEEYADFVLFDAPSAVVFADAATLATIVDGVIIVTRANQSPRGSETQLKSLLTRANANILGVVLNDVPPSEVDSCHYYANYYATPSLLKAPVQAARDDEFTWVQAGLRDGTGSSDIPDEKQRA